MEDIPDCACTLGWMPAHILMHFTGNGINYADLRPFVKKKECHNIQITCFDENMMFYGIQVIVYKCSSIIAFIKSRGNETK